MNSMLLTESVLRNTGGHTDDLVSFDGSGRVTQRRVAHVSPTEPLGPIQLRVMNYLWRVKVATIHQIRNALNSEPGAIRLSYSTFLTVSLSLMRRNLVDKRKTSPRSTEGHQFFVVVDEAAFKAGVVKQIVHDYCGNNLDLLRHLLRYAPATDSKDEVDDSELMG